MIKSRKIAGLLFAFTLISSAGVFAQTQPMPQQQQQQVDVDVSDAELAKFADAYQKIRMVNQKAQQEMVKKVEDGGFDVQRFNKIHQASLDPNTEVDATEEEMSKHKEVVADIEGMQGKFQKEMEDAISDEGLEVKRYEKIAMALQTDTELQQRLQKLMQG